MDYYTFKEEYYNLMWQHFLFQKLQTYILIIQVVMKNMYCCFCIKTQYSFILDYRGVGEEVYLSVWGVGAWVGGERALNL